MFLTEILWGKTNKHEKSKSQKKKQLWLNLAAAYGVGWSSFASLKLHIFSIGTSFLSFLSFLHQSFHPPPTHYILESWLMWGWWRCSVLILQKVAPVWHIWASSLLMRGSSRLSHLVEIWRLCCAGRRCPGDDWSVWGRKRRRRRGSETGWSTEFLKEERPPHLGLQF